MRLVCISDTHMQLNDVGPWPAGDILIHAGDLTYRGTPMEVQQELATMAALPYATKLLVPGNHDWLFSDDPAEARSLCKQYGVTLLLDSSIMLGGLEFYGTPWMPNFYDWAFMLPRQGELLAAKHAKIPDNVDVLITHGPPWGILDTENGSAPLGDETLIAQYLRIKPKVHVFGHIHESYGSRVKDGTTFINAASCNSKYRPVNKPIVIGV